jgi:hypothetical protein
MIIPDNLDDIIERNTLIADQYRKSDLMLFQGLGQLYEDIASLAILLKQSNFLTETALRK